MSDLEALLAIWVNLACLQGVTVYQTDYSMAALTLRAPGSPMQPLSGEPFNLPMASMEGQPGMAQAPASR